MHVATLSSKYQLCIPKQVRDELGIKAGQQFLFIPKGKGLHLVPRLAIEDVRGSMQGAATDRIRDREDRA